MLKSRVTLLFVSLLIVIVVASLVPTGMRGTILWRELQNFGHVPAYGVIAVAFLAVFRQFKSLRLSRPLEYLAAVAAATMLGAVVEVIQYFGPRDADPGDILRNFLGATSFVLLFAVWESRKPQRRFRGRFTRTIMFVVGLLTLGAALQSPVRWGMAYLYRSNQFPVICDFESYWGTMFLVTQDARLQRSTVPDEWFAPAAGPSSNHAGSLALLHGEYPGLSVTEPQPDWSGYNSLQFEVYSEFPDSFALYLRIDDIHHNNQYEDRYTGGFTIHHGHNLVVLPLEDIRTAPRGRQFDLRHVAKLLFFITGKQALLQFWIDNIKLQ